MNHPRCMAALATSLLLIGLAATAVSSAERQTRVARGEPVPEPAAAPWSAYVDFGDGMCSGTLIDLSRVVTTAECVAADGGVIAPQRVSVIAGTTRTGTSAGTGATEQRRGVRAIQVHPGHAHRRYRMGTANTEGGVSFAYDLAILTLGAAFEQTAQVSPVALAEATPPQRARVSLFGFGASGHTADAGVLDVLRSMTSRTTRASRCSDGEPSVLCVVSDSSPCDGDSGAGVVTESAPRRLVGIHSFHDGKCVTGQPSGAISTTEPGIVGWLRGTPSPTLAPSARRRARVVFGDRGRRVLACRTPLWRGATKVRTLFVEDRTHRTLYAGSRFRPRGADRRRAVYCASIASNAGGTTEVSSTNWVRVGAR